MKKTVSLTVATTIIAAILVAFAIACTGESAEIERIVEVEVTRVVTVETVVEKQVVKEIPVEKVVVQQKVDKVPVEVVVEREVVKEIPVEKLVVKEVVETVLVEVVVEREFVQEKTVETVIVQQVVVTATTTPTPTATPSPTPTPTPIPSGSAATDREALIALYNATDGPNWTNNANWLSDRPMQTWHGVRTDGNRVVFLHLGDGRLQGELPPEMGDLTRLKELWLGGDNDLEGAIPDEMSRLTRLEVLDLGGTGIGGAIPTWLGDLNRLWYLHLDANNFDGDVPAELGNLTRLQSFTLNSNSGLTGPLSTNLASISGLERFEFWGTGVCTPYDIEFQNWLSDIPDLRGLQTACPSDAPIPDVGGGRAIIRDIFGRVVNETGVVLVDWEGHIANPLMTYSVEFPAGVTVPTRVFLASDESRLMFDLPSQFGVNGPSKVVRLAGESPAGDFRITIFPDRDTADETHSLTLQYVDDNDERRSQTIDIHVVDQDRERPLEFNIIADFSYDKSGLFDDPVARATAQQGADDWAYFFANMNLDTVAAGEEMMWINDPGPWGIGKYEMNTYAYNGFLLQIYAQPNDGQGNGANASHDPDNQSSRGVRLPLKRSGIYHYDPRGNGNTNGWLTDPLDSEWWKAHDQSKPADLYSGVIHEGGHAIVFNRGHDGMAVFMEAGEINDPVVRAYFGSNPKIDKDAHLKGIDPASGRGIFGNGNVGHTFNGRTLPKKTDLLVAQAAGYQLRDTSPFRDLSISTDPLPEAKPGEEYTHTIEATGGIPAYYWAIDSGELPDGLSLDSFTGTISGIPTESGTFNFTPRLRDQTEGHPGITLDVTLTISN